MNRPLVHVREAPYTPLVPADEASPPDIAQLFIAACEEHASRTAVVCDEHELCYVDLRARAVDFAHRVGPECVGIEAVRTVETITGLLGVLIAGGTYCPIDPTFPRDRRAALLEAAACTALVSDGSRQFEDVDRRVIRLTPHRSATEAVAPPLHLAAGSSIRPAYIMFTSGSTGHPKGVATSRPAITIAANALRRELRIGPADRILQFASLNWDTSLEEILPTLLSGATLVMDRRAHSGSLPQFMRVVREQAISVLNLPTAYWHELVLYLSDSNDLIPPSLKTVVIGGEAVRANALGIWRALGVDQVRLINTYGCTETTLVTHTADLSSYIAAADYATGVPIGFPLPHVIEHVTDDGELWIGGPSVALGYVNANNDRFCSVDRGNGLQRYYRTGDLVSKAPSGAKLYRGRMDDEMKIAGIRVHPAEIEATISEHPEVQAVAVAGIELSDQPAIAAVVVPGAGSDAAMLANAVRDHVQARLPRHMWPARIIVRQRLAYTTTGKVDRRASLNQTDEP